MKNTFKTHLGKPTFKVVCKEALADGDKLDSNELLGHIILQRHNGQCTDTQRLTAKNSLDFNLVTWCKEGWLLKSKNLMTDENVTSSQSKFIYYLKEI